MGHTPPFSSGSSLYGLIIKRIHTLLAAFEWTTSELPEWISGCNFHKQWMLTKRKIHIIGEKWEGRKGHNHTRLNYSQDEEKSSKYGTENQCHDNHLHISNWISCAFWQGNQVMEYRKKQRKHDDSSLQL